MDTTEYTTAQVAKACGLDNKMALLRLVWPPPRGKGLLPEVRAVEMGSIKVLSRRTSSLIRTTHRCR